MNGNAPESAKFSAAKLQVKFPKRLEYSPIRKYRKGSKGTRKLSSNKKYITG